MTIRDHQRGLGAVVATTVLSITGVMAITSPALADPAGDAAAGKTAFNRACRACHQVTPGARSVAGPNLAGISGRKAALDSDFRYSPALRAAAKKGLTWNARTLDEFLAQPRKLVPGTSMPIATPKAETRRDITAYLATTAARKSN